MQDVGFLLLAGGQSRRMGGGDKNQLHLGGKSVLQHVLDRVDRAGGPTAINANGDPQRFASYGLPVIADVIDGYAESLKIDKFDLVIDWGFLYFITKPLFSASLSIRYPKS